jgi:hypothetical protein
VSAYFRKKASFCFCVILIVIGASLINQYANQDAIFGPALLFYVGGFLFVSVGSWRLAGMLLGGE